MLTAQNICIRYGSRTVVKDFSLKLKAGEKHTLFGESGCGKTSLLRVFAGLQQPNEGHIELNDIPLSAQTITSFRKSIGYLPQLTEVPIEDFDSFADQIALNRQNRVKAGAISAAVGLNEETLKEPFNTLSGGERQRVLLSLILAQDKEIFLLDEPTSALDQETTKFVFDYIMSIDQSVIAVSHNKWWIEQAQAKRELFSIVEKA